MTGKDTILQKRHEISLFVTSIFIGILILSSILLFNQIIVYRYFEFTCGTLWLIITTGMYVSLSLGIGTNRFYHGTGVCRDSAIAKESDDC